MPAGAVAARAQEAPAPAAFQPTLDAGDLGTCCGTGAPIPSPAIPARAPPTPRRDHFFVAAPTIASKPSTGLSVGLNSNLAFFSGDEKTTHISSISGGLRVSQKKQVLSGVRFNMFTPDDRWFIAGDNRLSWTSQNTYGLGADTIPLGPGTENLKYNAFKLYETAYRTSARTCSPASGSTSARTPTSGPATACSRPSTSRPMPPTTTGTASATSGQTSAGTSAGLLFDTRDNGINAQRGWLASAALRTFFDGFLGGDSTWQQLTVDVRTYRKLTRDGRQKLAFWFLSDNVLGGTAPYLDLPATGSDGRSARGYSDGRYRGEHLAYGEVEYRGTVTSNGLLGVRRVHEHDDGGQRRRGEKAVRGFRAGGRVRPARAVEQALAHEPDRRLRLGERRIPRTVSRDPGSLLVTGCWGLVAGGWLQLGPGAVQELGLD